MNLDDATPWSIDPAPARGAGNFGRWAVDAWGRPAYDYGDGPGGDREDHWHLIGNDAITATAHAAGHVLLYDWSRGGKIVNRFHPASGRYAGGYCFVSADGQMWSTRHADLPEGAAQTRRFGSTYLERTTCAQGVTITEHVAAAAGSIPALVQTVTIRNDGEDTRGVVLVPFWQPCMHQLTVAPIMTHGLERVFDAYRARLNRRFKLSAFWNDGQRTLRLDWRARRPDKRPPAARARIVDHHPGSAFLSILEAPAGVGFSPITDAGRFMGADPCCPVGMNGCADGALVSGIAAHGPGAALAVRVPLTLAPGALHTFRFAFGYGPAARIPAWVDTLQSSAPDGSVPVLEVAAPEAPELAREAAWHSAYLQAGSLYSEFFDAHFVDQGSAYSYLQGGSGAPRDIALFILPLIYLRPDLARDSLRFLMRSQRANGAFPYAWFGHGCFSGGGVHSRSSDLDLFFAWALSEYVLATRDFAFLDEEQPFYPPTGNRVGSVLDHVRASFAHLRDDVRTGPHDLIRAGTGDWNDVLLGFSRVPPLTILRGESTLNAGLATVALPALADAVESRDATLAAEMRGLAEKQRRALQHFWTGEWVARGYPGYGKKLLGVDRIFLDTQSFGVLGGAWSEAQCATLFKSIQAQCVAPQGVGARCLYPPMKGPLLEPGSDTNGGTWAAIDSWVAWAWAKHDPAAAWRFFVTTTLFARAEAYPDCWYGVWSGPDAYNAHYHPRPAETFNLNATPMSRYPVMNMNRHSGPLLNVIKFAGFAPRGDAFVMDPKMPFDTFSVRTPLAGCAYSPEGMEGQYRCTRGGDHRFAVRPPSGAGWEVRMGDAVVASELGDEGLLRFTLAGSEGEMLRWAVVRADKH